MKVKAENRTECEVALATVTNAITLSYDNRYGDGPTAKWNMMFMLLLSG